MKSNLSKEARQDLLARIKSNEVASAFELLVAGLDDLGVFVLSPNIRGQKKSLHFKSGKVSYFAFIANSSWLLWYFRRPGLRDDIFNFEELQTSFPGLESSNRTQPDKTEAILRIRTRDEANRVLSFVRDKTAVLRQRA